MITIEQKDLDLEQIADSGQCFRMNRLAQGVYGVTAFQTHLEITQQGESFALSCEEEEFERLWRGYFDLDTDYGAMKAAVDPMDSFMQNSIKKGGGIRILRQELWEMIISFIISQNNNITRIKKNIETLCSKFGEPIEVPKPCVKTLEMLSQNRVYSFPTPERLAGLTLTDLSGCGLGYRDKYILCAAAAVKDKSLDLAALPAMEYEDAKRALLSVCGIGIKVAECICLFGLHHIEAFPIDTHVKHILEEHYPNGFPFERYEGFAGVLQQYGFYARLLETRKK